MSTTSKVSIQFTSLTNLWAFRKAINVNVFEINMYQVTITCECSNEQVHLAVTEYNGHVIELKKQEA